MIDVVFGVVGIIGTGITIWQASVAAAEVKKAKQLAVETKQNLDEIIKIQKAIGLGTIINEVNRYLSKVTDLVSEVKGRNEKKIRKELLIEITRIGVLIPNEYLAVHNNIKEIEGVILYHINHEISFYQNDEDGQNGITKIYDLTYIVLQILKDSIE